jgi:XTP/dITP diphosphohydrolase
MKKVTIILATKNRHKLEEIQRICKDLAVEWIGLSDLSQSVEIEENGESFEENALIKARGVHRVTELPVVADDSGLIVDALNGAPGIYSSRFSGPDATTEENNALLLKKLQNVPDEKRTARFVTVAAFVDANLEKLFRGEIEGKIIRIPRGDTGFGYDPLFQPEGYEKTFAELGEEVKNSISHRARAFNQLKQFLKEYYFSKSKE